MNKGLGVIIATKLKDGSLSTDSIVNCDAKAFSISTPCILQKADLSKVSSDKPLYLCGHGSCNGKKISGYSIKDIALMLKEHGYSGKQTIYVASCYAARKHRGKNVADVLQCELKNLDINCDCIAISRDISIVLSMPGSDVECASIKFTSQHRKAFFRFQSELFGKFSIDNCRSDLSKNYDSVMSWNSDIVHGKLMPLIALNGEINPVITATLIAFILALLKISLIAIPVALVWIIAELATLRGWTISILLMASAMLMTINAGFVWIVITRLILCIIAAVIANLMYMKRISN